jgi:hypothetical protein
MPKSKLAAKIRPPAKVSGIIRSTPAWAWVVARIEKGQEVAVEIHNPIDGIVNPQNAFLAALKRKYRRTYQIYARNGVIYAVPKP